MNLDRAAGSLLGASCGDAMGVPVEFTSPTPADFPKVFYREHFQMRGFGTHHTFPGMISDDTHLAICLAESLCDSGLEEPLDPTGTAKRYLAWRAHTFDCGGQTASSLSDFQRTQDGLDCGRGNWEKSKGSAANGSLMRAYPIGVWFQDPGQVVENSMADSAITHFDPRCQIACAAYNNAISEVIYGCDADEDLPSRIALMVEAAIGGTLNAGLHWFNQYPEFQIEGLKATEDILRDIRMSAYSDPEMYGKDVGISGYACGFVRTAFRLAMWMLRHAPTYESAIGAVICLGHDSDTNAAIVGGLLGARDGIKAIPEDWLATVRGALKDKKYGRFSPELATTYHPDRFDRMIEILEKHYSEEIKAATKSAK